MGSAGGGSSLAEVSEKAPDQLSSAEATGDPDPGCSRTVDLDMALGHSSGLDITMQATQICMSPDGGGMALRHGLKWWPRPWASLWSSVITWAMDINTDPVVVEPGTLAV